jgi:hypothetical protein
MVYVKTNLAEFSKAGYGSKRAVLPMMKIVEVYNAMAIRSAKNFL